MSSTASRPIATMYERWTLDCVIEVVQAIVEDFIKRPRQYRLVSDTSAGILQDFWYLSGTDPSFPNLQKRELIFGSMLGPSDGRPGEHASQFHVDSGALRQKADNFTNRVFSTGEDNLRRAFRDEAITFRSYLETLENNIVVSIGDRQTRSIFEKAVQVLLDQTVTSVFGRPPASVKGWPLGGTFDSNGAQVVEEVITALETTMGEISQSQFVVQQRIGIFGGETIKGVLDSSLSADIPNAEIDRLIHIAYSWKTALDTLKGS